MALVAEPCTVTSRMKLWVGEGVSCTSGTAKRSKVVGAGSA